MNEICRVTSSCSQPSPERPPAEGLHTAPVGPSNTASESDRVELSRDAVGACPLPGSAAPPAEADPRLEHKIAEIRAQIANDTYLTPDKLDAAVEALLRKLLSE